MSILVRHSPNLHRNIVKADYMIHRFVSKPVEEKEIKIEVVQNFKHLGTVIKYPAPDPRDRIDDEYDDRDHYE